MENAHQSAMPFGVSINSVGDMVSSADYDAGTGLTKREHFAGLAMQAYISGNLSCSYGLDGGHDRVDTAEAAKEAVEYADALLAELEK